MRRVSHPSFFCLGGTPFNRAVRLVGREGCSLSRIGCETGCLFPQAIRCPAISSPARWSAEWLLRSWSSRSALPRMFLVAGDQQDGTLVTVGVRSKPGNLSSVVDIVCFRYCHVRAGKNQGLQVHDGTSVLPQEPMVDPATVSRIAHNLLAGIDCVRCSARIASQNPEIGHHAFLPQKAMACRSARIQLCASDNFSRIVDPPC